MTTFPLPSAPTALRTTMTSISMALALTLLCVTALPSPAAADEASKAAATRLVDATMSEEIFDKLLDSMVQMQVQAAPQAAPFREVMMEFFSKYMTWEDARAETIRLYAEEFTATELDEMTKFYSSPTGRKALEKMPTISQQGMAPGMRRAEENRSELQAAMQAKAAEMQGACGGASGGHEGHDH